MELLLAILIFMGVVGGLVVLNVGLLKITEALMWLFYGD